MRKEADVTLTDAIVSTPATTGMLFSRSVGVILAVLLAGCAATQTEPNLDLVVPEAGFLAVPGEVEPVAEQWWNRFGDAQLSAFVEQALDRNPALGQALAQLRQADAQARIARADRYPQVGAGFSASRQRQNLAGLGAIGELPGLPADQIPSSFNTSTYSLSLDVSWELDLWGRISAQTAAARADYLASVENHRAFRQSVAAEATRLYFSVSEARAQLVLAEDILATASEVARQVGNRAAVGIASPTDRELAIANVESARAGVEQRRETLERSVRQLEILLREYPAGTLVTADTLPDPGLAPPPGLPADLLVRRPDVAAAELGLHAAGYRLTAARRSFLPSISLTGALGHTSNELGDLLSGNTSVWSIAGSILQPIFQGGRLVAQVRVTEGQRDEALEAYAETALRALAEVETALAVETVLAQREMALEKSAQAAENAVRISFNRYREGIDPFMTVLESQQRALDSRSAWIAVRRARLNNRIDLHLALGGGFEEAPDALLAGSSYR